MTIKSRSPRKTRKGALDLALAAAVEQASNLQQGKKLPVGKKITGGSLTARLMVPATAAQQREIRAMLEEEWLQLEPRLIEKIGKIIGKDMKRI